MKNQLTISLIFITSVSVFAQRHQIIQKEFEVDKNTSIVLNLDKISVAFEEATDGKIHFYHVIEFDGYSKKEIEAMLEKIEVETTAFESVVSLKAKSKSRVDVKIFDFDSPYGFSIRNVFFRSKKDSIVRKSKDSLLKEISRNYDIRLKSNLKYINNRFKLIDKNGKSKKFIKGNFKIARSEFVIKLPPFVKVAINANEANLYFRNDIQNKLSIISNNGAIKAKAITNSYNKIEVIDANFEATNLIGGDYILKNISKGKIGEISNVKINSEFSKIEIGEIGKQAKITDFNSEYWFYNWSQDFQRFDLNSEYSKIHLFYPKANHSMKVKGNNTKHIIGKDFVADLQPTKKGEKHIMMTKESHPDKAISGEIFFDIVHGIIYTHEDSIKTINK